MAIASGLWPVRSLFELLSECTIAVQSCKCFAERVNWVFVLVVLVNSTGQKGSKRMWSAVVLWGSDKTHAPLGVSGKVNGSGYPMVKSKRVVKCHEAFK